MDIKLYPKNAKKHPDEQIELIAKSLKRFGWQQPIKVGDGNIIIVGHGRYMAYLRYPEDIKTPWVIDSEGKTINGEPEPRKLTKEEEVAYRLADNKINESDWDMSLVRLDLNDLPEDLVALTGFDKDDMGGEQEIPERKFAEELLEEHNYVVLYFDNEIDWLNFQSIYPLETQNLKGKGEKAKGSGIGRVIKGTDFINKVVKNGN